MKSMTLKQAIKLYQNNFQRLKYEEEYNKTESSIYQEMWKKLDKELPMREAINKTNELLKNWANLGNNRFSCDRFYVFDLNLYYSREGDNTKDKKAIVIGLRDLENPEYGINYDDDDIYFIHGRLIKIEMPYNEEIKNNLSLENFNYKIEFLDEPTNGKWYRYREGQNLNRDNNLLYFIHSPEVKEYIFNLYKTYIDIRNEYHSKAEKFKDICSKINTTYPIELENNNHVILNGTKISKIVDEDFNEVDIPRKINNLKIKKDSLPSFLFYSLYEMYYYENNKNKEKEKIIELSKIN